MKTTHKIIILIITIFVVLLPDVVQADTYGSVTCTKVGMFNVYRCDDGRLFGNYADMNNFYTPPLEETYIPTTTYIYSGTSEGLTVVP